MKSSDSTLFSSALDRIDSMPSYGHLIANQWLRADRSPLSVVAPATGQNFAWLARGGAPEIDAAVSAARAALEGEWGRPRATERGRTMLRYSALILRDVERLAGIEAHDPGKPISQAR